MILLSACKFPVLLWLFSEVTRKLVFCISHVEKAALAKMYTLFQTASQNSYVVLPLDKPSVLSFKASALMNCSQDTPTYPSLCTQYET